MAQNKVTIHFEGKGSEKLRRQLKMLADQQDRINGKTNQFSSESKKASKQTRILGGSIATARSVMLLYSFAVGSALNSIMGLVRESAKLEAVSSGFANLGEQAGFTSKSMDMLREATRNTVSDMGLMIQANNALILGVAESDDQMASLFKAARRLGAALGRDTLSSVESLVTGIGRQSRLMLDNLGIIVKSEEAYERYAVKIKKSTKELTNNEKKLAFTAEAMERIEEATKKLGNDFLTSEQKISKATASFDNLKTILGAKLAPIIGTTSEFWVDFLGGVDTGTKILPKQSHVMLELEERARSLGEQLDRSFVLFTEDGNMVSDLSLQIANSLEFVNAQLKHFQKLNENPEDFLLNPKNLEKIRGEWEGVGSAIEKIGSSAIFNTNRFDDTLKVTNDLINNISSSLSSAVISGQNLGEAVVNSLKAIAAQIASKALLYSIAGVFMPTLFGGSALRFGLGLSPVPEASTGGLVGGRRHSQGGTIIEAEQGEYIMSRNAVNAVGVEAMNRINQGQGAGNVNISFTGNVMSQDFIEDEAIPMIKEAIRRGADIGVS